MADVIGQQQHQAGIEGVALRSFQALMRGDQAS